MAFSMTTSQSIKEVQFKYRMAEVLKDLQAAGARDGEAMAMIGSLAARIARSLGKKSWSDAKSAMTATNYNELLASFQREGNAFHQAGKRKQAYAVQALSCSLVAATQRSDSVIAEGERLLDALIDHATTAALRAVSRPVRRESTSKSAPRRRN